MKSVYIYDKDLTLYKLTKTRLIELVAYTPSPRFDENYRHVSLRDLKKVLKTGGLIKTPFDKQVVSDVQIGSGAPLYAAVSWHEDRPLKSNPKKFRRHLIGISIGCKHFRGKALAEIRRALRELE